MARRASYYKSLANGDSVCLIVDAGGFTARHRNVDTLRSEYLLKGLSLLGYDAVNLGDDDLCLGKKFLLRTREKYKLPFISANVYDAESSHLFAPPYVIKTFGGWRIFCLIFGGFKIGVFGLTSDECLPECSDNDNLGFKIKDAFNAARETVERLRSRCELVIALAHLGTKQCKELTKQVPGIDLVVCGHGTIPKSDPWIVDETMIVQSGAQGRHVGEVEMKPGDNNLILASKAKLTRLDKTFPDDPVMSQLVEEYKNVRRKNVKFVPKPARVSFRLYVGAMKCRECHPAEFSRWNNSKHAKAFALIKKAPVQKQLECLKCHCTDYENFTNIGNGPQEINFKNVQCEACHGAGYKHVYYRKKRQADDINKILKNDRIDASSSFLHPDSSVCYRCHGVKDPDFCFEKSFLLISHRKSDDLVETNANNNLMLKE